MRESFSQAEIQLAQDAKLIERKNELLEKCFNVFALQGKALYAEYAKSFPSSPSPKVNRGEHHQGFPYLMLDYPRLFSTDDVFAFRTLFWWGNFISCTLHLKGSHLTECKSDLPFLLEQINSSELNFRFSARGDEWDHNLFGTQYHTMDAIDLNDNYEFLKLSTSLPIEEINKLPSFFKKAHETLLGPLK